MYDPEPEQNDTNGFNNHFLNEYEFLTSIQEVCNIFVYISIKCSLSHYLIIMFSVVFQLGCGSSSNRDIEERWRKRVELNESRLKEETVAKKPEQVIKKPVQRTPQYKNNALMRGLLDKKMALEVSNEDKNIDSERNIINVPLYNNGDLLDEDGPVLTALSEDPEIFCLRDTAGKKSDIIYDDYRFAHHGKKTTVTPRFYSHYEIDDKDFEFKKK